MSVVVFAAPRRVIVAKNGTRFEEGRPYDANERRKNHAIPKRFVRVVNAAAHSVNVEVQITHRG